jgi:hypothetical protein
MPSIQKGGVLLGWDHIFFCETAIGILAISLEFLLLGGHQLDWEDQATFGKICVLFSFILGILFHASIDREVVTTIANILHRLDKGLAEVEEAWECRDVGFNCAWVSDALYKAGNSSVNEHPGAIIRSMSAKSYVRWASPVARGG